MSLELSKLGINDRSVEKQQYAEYRDQMIYLLRKSPSQHPCYQPFPRCPVGQLVQPLIQGIPNTPNYATREQKHTQHTPASVKHISVTETPLLFHFAFLSTSPPFLSPSFFPSGTCCTVGQSGSIATRPLPYGRCHGQVIRPHYEDICGTLINKSVVLPLNLFSPSLSCPCLSSGCGLSPHSPYPDVCPCTIVATRLQT